MKILNIFPIDWNSPDCLPERTWTIPNERGDNFNWITGMFHETITSKIIKKKIETEGTFIHVLLSKGQKAS